MSAVEGRDEDFFLLPDGRRVSQRRAYEAVAGVLPFSRLGNNLFSAIRAFQVVQERTDLVVVNVVPGPSYSPDLWEGVDGSARELHPTVRVEIRCRQELEASPGGKLKQVMSWVGGGDRAEAGS